MKYNIIQFKNGKYGIIKTNWLGLFPRYVDLQSTQYHWSIGSAYFKDCAGTLEECEKVFGYFSYKVIK